MRLMHTAPNSVMMTPHRRSPIKFPKRRDQPIVGIAKQLLPEPPWSNSRRIHLGFVAKRTDYQSSFENIRCRRRRLYD